MAYQQSRQIIDHFRCKSGRQNQKKNPKHRGAGAGAGAGAVVTTWGFLNVSMVKNLFPQN